MFLFSRIFSILFASTIVYSDNQINQLVRGWSASMDIYCIPHSIACEPGSLELKYGEAVIIDLNSCELHSIVSVKINEADNNVVHAWLYLSNERNYSQFELVDGGKIGICIRPTGTECSTLVSQFSSSSIK